MKKILLVILALFMLVGCKAKTSQITTVDTSDNTDNQKFDMEFPAEELIGIWNGYDSSDYVIIRLDASLTIGNYDTGEKANYQVEGCDCVGYYIFDMKLTGGAGLKSTLTMDVSPYAHGQISIGETYYEYVGMDEYQASMANRFRKIESFYGMVKGYFNSDEYNVFLRFGIDEGSYYLLYGLYYAGGTPYGYIQDIKDYGDGIYEIVYAFDVETNFSNDESLYVYLPANLSNLENGKAVFDGDVYHYLGEVDFDEALADYDEMAEQRASEAKG